MSDLHPSVERAIAAAQPPYLAAVTSPEFLAFGNGLCVLRNLDCEELLAAGVIDEPTEFRRFDDDPFRFFLRASDRRAAALWDLIQDRQPKALQARSKAAISAVPDGARAAGLPIQAEVV